MDLTAKPQLQRYLFWLVVLGLIAVAVYMVTPFVGAIMAAYILAYMARPLYLRLSKSMPNGIAAALCVILAILLVVVPVTLITINLLEQTGGAIQHDGALYLFNAVVNRPLVLAFNIDVQALREQYLNFVSTVFTGLLQALPDIVIGTIIALTGMYYILCSWEKLGDQLKKYLPFKNKERLLKDLDHTTGTILFGTLIMSVVEFGVALAGFTLANVQASILFAVLIFILAFVPSVGPIVVWAPVAAYLAVTGQVVPALIVTAMGLILTVGIENILYTKYVGDRTSIHPFIMLLGVIAGIAIFGVFGFIIGPLVLANTIDILEEAAESH